jgi:hypothetical protein
LSLAPDTPIFQIPENVAPMWPHNIPLDIQVYVTSSPWLVPLRQLPADSLVVDEHTFGYGDWKDKREIQTSFEVPKQSRDNGTVWAHFLIAQAGNQLDPSGQGYDSSKAYHFARPITQLLPRKKAKKTRNLLAAMNETEKAEYEAELELAKKVGTVFASHYHPNFTFSFVPDMGVANYPSMHPGLRTFMQLERSGARDESGRNGWYYPTLYVNTFWQLKHHMSELNETVTRLPLNINLNNIPPWQFTIVASMDEGMKINADKSARGETVGPGADGAEFEEFKKILLDSNIYLLGLTGVVSVLHMLFEMLAFKNDVQHFRSKKDNVGTSVNTILANVVMQSVIFLYLLDNNENTSWMILLSQGMGIAIEGWKITKTSKVVLRQNPPGSLLPYMIVLEDKHKLSELEKKTQDADAVAFTWLVWLMIPLLFAYAGYSLYYDTHKSWYSFIITTLVGSVYAYGFLLMLPALYINYQLKSVAHLSGRVFVYKAISTFIDDLFAFTIKMPLLHRLATLRDDVVFVVYLYQLWIYRVDYRRVNEFGQGGEEREEVEEDSKVKAIEAEDKSTKPELTEQAETSEGVLASGVEKKDRAKKRK